MKKGYNSHQDLQQKKLFLETKTSFLFNTKKGKILSFIIVIAFPVLLYLQTIAFGFTKFDDDLLIQNNLNFLSNFHNAPGVFATDAFLSGSTKFYRPLQTLSYMVDISISGIHETWMFHLTHVLLLGAIACLLLILLMRFLVPLPTALFSTLIYCAHPLFVSNVAWIPARGDLLLMLFSLMSFLFLIEFFKNSKTIWLLLHWISFFIALFCKETAIILPLLYILYYFIISGSKRIEPKLIMNAAAYIVSGIIWFWLRAGAISSITNNSEVLDAIFQNNNIGLKPFLQNLRTIPESISCLFIPLNIKPIPDFSLFKLISGLGFIILLCILFIKNQKRSGKLLLFYLLWYLLLVFPTMLYKNSKIDYLNHRFFLPQTGILLFVLSVIPDKWTKSGKTRNVWLLGVMVVALSVLTFYNSRSYKDPLTFYDSAVRENSNSALAYNNRGFIYYSKGFYDKAIYDYTKAIDLKTDYAQAYYNRGAAYLNMKLYDKAARDYTRAIELVPGYVYAYNNRAAVYMSQGRFDNAIEDCSKAIQLKPDYAPSYYNRGILYSNLKLDAKAMEDYSKAIVLKPDYAEVYCDRGNLYKTMGALDKAIADYSKAIEIIPGFAAAYNNRGTVYFSRGWHDRACEDFKKAAALNLSEAVENSRKYCH
jgi:protein O-mannosyl-transferase